jgi:hypothetical protein
MVSSAMSDLAIGLLAIAVGALFCFRGFMAMRIVIPIWGAFAGFLLGAGLVDAATDEPLFDSLLAWLVGLGLAIVFAAIAYLYYEVSVVLAMGATGFALGSGAMVAAGATWSWLIILVGVLAGALLAVVAIVADLPMIILVVLTAFAGATSVVLGVMLLAGVVDTVDLDVASTTEQLDDDWWWYVSYLALGIVGIVMQTRHTAQMNESMRAQWSEAGGRELRSH